MADPYYPDAIDPHKVGEYDVRFHAGGGYTWDSVLEYRVWMQPEHINEPQPGVFEHVTTERITEWPPQFLVRPRRTDRTIPDFFAVDAPHNRLDIIRGLVPPGNVQD